MTPARFEALLRTYFDPAMPPPKDDTPLEALGFDGDDMVDILVAIERADRRKISDDQAVQLATWGDLRRLAVPQPEPAAAPSVSAGPARAATQAAP